jgi:hypothetical protein
MVSASNVDGDWCLKVVNSNHNHAGSTNMAAHPLARRMQDSEAAVVNTGIALGQSARLIMASLRQSHSENLTVRKDVYNARQKLRSEQLAGRSPIQFLKDQLTEKGWPFTFFQNAEGHVERLFFAHPTGLSLARQYPEVFVLDNTYKTNMYGMPLFHIVGITSTNTSFSAGFCFLRTEDSLNYAWALERFLHAAGLNAPILVTDRDLALRLAIQHAAPRSPHLLCLWHINKNVLAHAKKHYKDQPEEECQKFYSAWNDVVRSESIATFNTRNHQLHEKFAGKKAFLNYLDDTWLLFKECFVLAWTRQYTHFGHTSTSRGEGAHNFVKAYIASAACDLTFAFERISMALDDQLRQAELESARDSILTLHAAEGPFYANVLSRVSRYALRLVIKEHEKARKHGNDDPSPTDGVFHAIMGLPCYRIIAQRLKEPDARLFLTDFHWHWHLRQDGEQTNIPPYLTR